MFCGGHIKLFDEWSREFGLRETKCFSYTQIRHWLLHDTNKQAACRDLTLFEKWVVGATGSRGTTSQLYGMILAVPETDRTAMMESRYRYGALGGSV